MKVAALAWLLVVGAACAVLVLELYRGVELQTDLTALLPLEERDTTIQRAKDRVTDVLAERVFLLVGDRDRDVVRSAGAALATGLRNSGLTKSVTYRIPAESLMSLGAMYYPYRFGLLSETDRNRLERRHGREIVDRAIATIYGPSSIADATLLRSDPFLLLPEFLSSLPMPIARLAPDDGVLSTRKKGITWVLLIVQLNGKIYSGEYQDRFVATLNTAERYLRTASPGLQILRVGAIFYARAGGRSATRETARLGVVSTIGTALLILIVFRSLRPLLLTLLAIVVGVLCAFSVSFMVFGGIHVAALLIGISLNGIAIDYCLQYVSARFSTIAMAPSERLHLVLPGIVLGAATTLIGYLTLMIAPFPGLFQLAVFSSVGLLASFITIVVWLPIFDSPEPLSHGARVLTVANALWEFWENPRRERWRWSIVGLLVIFVLAGTARLKVDDDIRHQQSLSRQLRAQESAIRDLTGISGSTQFLVVQGADSDAALQAEEVLQAQLASAQQDGALRGFQSIAQFIPSIARQRDNRALVQERLIGPYLESYYKRLGITGDAKTGDPGYLTPDAINEGSPLSFLRNQLLESNAAGTYDLVLLNGVARPSEIRSVVSSIPRITFVDPAEDVTRLLSEYRRRALILMVVSVLLMTPVLVWRYGVRGAAKVIFPPAIAVTATPSLLALGGVRFTFFAAMALVLVLSIGFDYAVFCRESDPLQRGATMLGIWLAMFATLLSFGLLVFSSTYAIHTFGATLLLGTLLACAFSPLASDGVPPQEA
jgi:predicted exporter